MAACRTVLLDTLRTAAARPATAVYPGDANCAAGNQWCADAILQSPLGGITHPLIAWQNRPTYQQVVSFPARRGQDLTNNQVLTVDLGSTRSVTRAVLRWEAAYGRTYRIEVSTNGTAWTPVWSTATGNGGTDVVEFPPTSARYVRMAGITRATSYGYSLYGFEVYAN